MKMSGTYPSGCGNRGTRQSASASHLLLASNDNRNIACPPEQTVEELSSTSNRKSPFSMGLDRLSLVPYGYIEAGVQDLSPAGLIALTFATLIIFGTNIVANVAGFLMFQINSVFPGLSVAGFLSGG